MEIWFRDNGLLAKMLLTAGLLSFSTPYEKIREKPLMNGSSEITIGGFADSQADSLRLQIEAKFPVTQTESFLLFSIIKSFSEPKFYTPSRLLLGKTEISALKVVITKAPSPDQIVWDGKEIVHYLVIEMEEASP